MGGGVGTPEGGANGMFSMTDNGRYGIGPEGIYNPYAAQDDMVDETPVRYNVADPCDCAGFHGPGPDSLSEPGARSVLTGELHENITTEELEGEK